MHTQNSSFPSYFPTFHFHQCSCGRSHSWTPTVVCLSLPSAARSGGHVGRLKSAMGEYSQHGNQQMPRSGAFYFSANSCWTFISIPLDGEERQMSLPDFPKKNKVLQLLKCNRMVKCVLEQLLSYEYKSVSFVLSQMCKLLFCKETESK